MEVGLVFLLGGVISYWYIIALAILLYRYTIGIGPRQFYTGILLPEGGGGGGEQDFVFVCVCGGGGGGGRGQMYNLHRYTSVLSMTVNFTENFIVTKLNPYLRELFYQQNKNC